MLRWNLIEPRILRLCKLAASFATVAFENVSRTTNLVAHFQTLFGCGAYRAVSRSGPCAIEIAGNNALEQTEQERAGGQSHCDPYKSEKFEDKLSDIDLVYDLIGGETQERSYQVLKHRGALISTLQEPDKAKNAFSSR